MARYVAIIRNEIVTIAKGKRINYETKSIKLKDLLVVAGGLSKLEDIFENIDCMFEGKEKCFCQFDLEKSVRIESLNKDFDCKRCLLDEV